MKCTHQNVTTWLRKDSVSLVYPFIGNENHENEFYRCDDCTYTWRTQTPAEAKHDIHDVSLEVM